MLEKFFFALLKFSDKLSKLFDGIHPTLRQVPPNVPLDSIHAVLNPSCQPYNLPANRYNIWKDLKLTFYVPNRLSHYRV